MPRRSEVAVTRWVSMASMPKRRMGLPPRSLAADAYDCIMVQVPDVGNLPNTRTWCAIFAPPPARFTSDRLALFWIWLVVGRPAERARASRRARARQGVAWKRYGCVLNDMRRPSLTDPAHGGHDSRGRDGRMGSAGGANKRMRSKERKKDGFVLI